MFYWSKENKQQIQMKDLPFRTRIRVVEYKEDGVIVKTEYYAQTNHPERHGNEWKTITETCCLVSVEDLNNIHVSDKRDLVMNSRSEAEIRIRHYIEIAIQWLSKKKIQKETVETVEEWPEGDEYV